MTARSMSVIINNFNYSRYLPEAIESALEQTHPNVEVIVVDDGSTDDSRAVISRYSRDALEPVLKENGGQASALNAGFSVSNGDGIIFLDADDALLRTAAACAAGAFSHGVSKVHWPMLEMLEGGERTGRIVPFEQLPSGDLRDLTFDIGPSSSVSPPSSGNAWARSFLEQVMPIPERAHHISADAFLFGIAPAFGEIALVPDPQSLYRIHGNNSYAGRGTAERLASGLSTFEQQLAALSLHAASLGRRVDVNRWRERSYFVRLARALEEMEAVTAEGSTIVLVDDCRLGMDDVVHRRRYVPFLERNGTYWGAPEDETTAVAELERLVAASRAVAIVFAWPSFWWLEYYESLAAWLRDEFELVVDNDRIKLFSIVKRLKPGHSLNKPAATSGQD